MPKFTIHLAIIVGLVAAAAAAPLGSRGRSKGKNKQLGSDENGKQKAGKQKAGKQKAGKQKADGGGGGVAETPQSPVCPASLQHVKIDQVESIDLGIPHPVHPAFSMSEWTQMEARWASGGPNSPLSAACKIAGALRIDEVRDLVAFDRVAPRLAAVGWRVGLVDLYETTTLGGSFQALRSIGYGYSGTGSYWATLELYNNPVLTKLDGAFASLEAVAGDVRFWTLDSLESFASEFESLRIIGGDLDIDNNHALASIEGFSALEAIRGVLKIRNNEVLATLGGGLQSLQCLDGVECTGSPICESAEMLRLMSLPQCSPGKFDYRASQPVA